MKKIKGITVEVTMYQVVCDGCAKINSPCKTQEKAMYIASVWKGWKEIGGKLYCPDCYEYDEKTNEYKPKNKN